MEKFDFAQTYFTAKKMMPDPGEVITTLWARKFALNAINGVGLIGTVEIRGEEPTSVRIPLSSIFLFPPSVHLMTYTSTFGWKTVNKGSPVYREVLYGISSEGITFYNGWTLRDDTTICCYRIHGV